MSISPCLRTWAAVLVLSTYPVGLIEAKEGPLFGNQRQGKILPTFARSCSVQVPRSGEVSITLKAVPDQVSGMRYMISDPPHHGTLSGILPRDGGDAVVVYRHNGGKSPAADDFSFRAQSPGRAKSAQATVHIEIMPPPAQLAFSQPSINFGSQFLDVQKCQDLILSNTGGVRARGRLVLPNGFSAPGGDRFDLDEGESVRLPIEFHPMEERRYSGEVGTVPFIKGECCRLEGVGIPRFHAERHGDSGLTLVNLTQQFLKLEIEHGNVWGIPPEITLPPGNTKEVRFAALEIPEDELSPTGSLRVSDGLTSTNLGAPTVHPYVPLTVEQIPWNSSNSIILGQSASLKFRLSNRSELPKNVDWNIVSRSGGGTEKSEVLLMEAGCSKEIAFEWKASLPGEAVVELFVRDGGKKLSKQTWIIPVTMAAPLSPPLTKQESQPVVASSDSSADAVPPAPVLIPPLEELDWEVKSPLFGRRSLVISYRVPHQGAEMISLEQLHHVFSNLPSNADGKSTSEKIFSPKPGAEFINFRVARNGLRESLIIDNAFPGIHELRLTIRGEGSNIPIAASALEVIIPYETPWWKRWKWCLAVLLLVVTVKWMHARQSAKGSAD